MGAHDVGIYKGIRAVNGAVDMGFGCKVDYGIYLVFLQQAQCEVVIPDIAMDKMKPGMIFEPSEVGFVSSIGQGIKHDHFVLRIFFYPVVHEVGADEACATSD